MSNNIKFSLEDIVFNKVSLDTSLTPKKGHTDLDIDTYGVLDTKNNRYYLTMTFCMFDDREEKPKISFKNFVFTELVGTFQFDGKTDLKTIPEHFWSNSIAMVYPFIRSFLTNLVFQADIERKFILPTLNLSGFGSELKENTSIK